MNKRQAKKKEFKQMWLTAFKWKQYRKNCKANARYQTERKWKVNDSKGTDNRTK